MSDNRDYPFEYVLRQNGISLGDLSKSLGFSRPTMTKFVKNYDHLGHSSVLPEIASAFEFLRSSTPETASARLRELERHRIHRQEVGLTFSVPRKGRRPKSFDEKLRTRSNSIYKSFSDLSFDQSITVLKGVVECMYTDATRKHFGKYLEEQKTSKVDHFHKVYRDELDLFFLYVILNRLVDAPPYEACGYPDSRAVKGYIESSLNRYAYDLDSMKQRDPDFDNEAILSDLGLQSLDFSRQWFVGLYFYDVGFKGSDDIQMLPETFAAKDVEDACRIAAYVDERDNSGHNAKYIGLMGPFSEFPSANDTRTYVWTDWDFRYGLSATAENALQWIEELKGNDYLQFNCLVDDRYRVDPKSFDIAADKDCYLTWYSSDEVRQEEEELLNNHKLD